MIMRNLYEFMGQLDREGIFFCFNGPISERILVEIGDTLKETLKLESASTTTILNVFSAVVEQTQNMRFYSARQVMAEDNLAEKERMRLGTIVVGFDGADYFVLSGNLIENQKIDKLKAKLVKVQNMDKKAIRAYYKQQLKNTPEADSRGAGLGFIDMARKASKPIEFDFRRIDERFSLFAIKIFISRD